MKKNSNSLLAIQQFEHHRARPEGAHRADRML
jgi:hypothetical protein